MGNGLRSSNSQCEQRPRRFRFQVVLRRRPRRYAASGLSFLWRRLCRAGNMACRAFATTEFVSAASRRGSTAGISTLASSGISRGFASMLGPLKKAHQHRTSLEAAPGGAMARLSYRRSEACAPDWQFVKPRAGKNRPPNVILVVTRCDHLRVRRLPSSLEIGAPQRHAGLSRDPVRYPVPDRDSSRILSRIDLEGARRIREEGAAAIVTASPTADGRMPERVAFPPGHGCRGGKAHSKSHRALLDVSVEAWRSHWSISIGGIQPTANDQGGAHEVLST